MWDIRRKINVNALPRTRPTVVEFTHPELPKDEQSYWLISKPGSPVDLCLIDREHDVDLFISADLKAMTSAWKGLSSMKAELSMLADQSIANSVQKWMVRGSYARSRAEEAVLSVTP
jgi:hypothetical protein